VTPFKKEYHMSIDFQTLAKAFETEAANATDASRVHTQTVMSILGVLDQEGYPLAKALPIASNYADFIVDSVKEKHLELQRKHKSLVGTETLNHLTAAYANHVIAQLPTDLSAIKRKHADKKSGVSRSSASDRKTVKHEAGTPPLRGSFSGSI
jgi:hypothetical protein